MRAEMSTVNCPDCGNVVNLCKVDVTVIEYNEDVHVSKSNSDKIQTWCYLPQEILDLIFNKLYFTSRIYFRGVCKDWRIPIGTRIDNELPWILCPKKNSSEMMLLDPNHKTCDSGSRHSVLRRSSLIYGTKGGWIMYRVRNTGSLIIIFLYCPFSGKFVTLPTLNSGLNTLYFGQNTSRDHATFSSGPMSSDCIFVVAHVGNVLLMGISTFRKGDVCWRTKIFNNDTFICNDVRQLCTSKGICYILFADGKLGSYFLENQEWSWLVESPCLEPFIFVHVLEFDGGLLSVRHGIDFGFTELFRYDEKERGWIEQKSLENKALFINQVGCYLRSTYGDTADLADVSIPPRNSFTEITVYSVKDEKFCEKAEAYEWTETQDLCNKLWFEPPY